MAIPSVINITINHETPKYSEVIHDGSMSTQKVQVSHIILEIYFQITKLKYIVWPLIEVIEDQN